MNYIISLLHIYTLHNFDRRHNVDSVNIYIMYLKITSNYLSCSLNLTLLQFD